MYITAPALAHVIKNSDDKSLTWDQLPDSDLVSVASYISSCMCAKHCASSPQKGDNLWLSHTMSTHDSACGERYAMS